MFKKSSWKNLYYALLKGLEFVAEGEGELSLFILFTSGLFVYFTLGGPVLLLHLEKKSSLVSGGGINCGCPSHLKQHWQYKHRYPLKIIFLHNNMDDDTLVISNLQSISTSIISFNPWRGFVK